MQVFNVSTSKFLCHNKYYGRSLTPAGEIPGVNVMFARRFAPIFGIFFCPNLRAVNTPLKMKDYLIMDKLGLKITKKSMSYNFEQ
jgi:hypothetical protein